MAAAQNKADNKGNASGDGATDSGGRKSLKIIIAVAVILFLEIGTVFVTAVLTNKPQVAVGDPFMDDASADEERIVEVPVLHERFPNRKQGIVILYDTEIALEVKKKHQDDVMQTIEENQARIKTVIGTIWRNAEPRHFNEPYLSTLTRQTKDALAEIIDEKVPEGEESRVVGVLIPVLVGWRGEV